MPATLRILLRRLGMAAGLCFGLASMAAAASAAPATGDDLVIESLAPSPAAAAQRSERQQWAAQPRDMARALAFAQSQLQLSRAQGDPRYAGRALAALQPWPDPQAAPLEVLLMRATLQQHLHDFDAARANLERLVQRDPRHSQAWLTLATIHRLQGRYAASAEACRQVQRSGEAFHGQACAAETAGLLGQVGAARQSLTQLQSAAPDDERRAWILTTLAELEARNSKPAAAERAYRQALALSSDGYARISYADFLLHQQRAAEVPAVLKGQPRSDSVLLRLTMAAKKTRASSLAQDQRELARRMAQLGSSGNEQAGHAREQAMWALWVLGDPQKALALARLNLGLQREPVDLLLLAEAARAGGQPQALAELAQTKKEMRLHDERLDALL